MLLGADGETRPTIFAEMSALAARTGAINLGQGFPDEDGPAEVLEAARQAISDGLNQYAPGTGLPVLRQAIATHQQRFYGLTVDPDREVLVTAGATEALAATLLALLEPGDEVVTLEPFYDSYAATIALAGARHRTVALRAPDFQPDLDELRAAITDDTRIVLINNPHNPTGSVLPRETLEVIVELADRHDAIIVTDEVYEHLTFGVRHTPVATLPGAASRTVTISSAGKTFSTTGWKIGWLTAPAELVEAILAVKQFLTYTNGTPFQAAIAVGLALPDSYFDDLALDAAREARHPFGRADCRGLRGVQSPGLVLRGGGCRRPRFPGCRGLLPPAARAGRRRRRADQCLRGRRAQERLRIPRALRLLQAGAGAGASRRAVDPARRLAAPVS